MFELRSTSYDLSKPLAAMAKRAKQDGFEFYYTRHIDEDVFELELRRDYIGVKTKLSGEYMNKYVPQSCVEGVLMGEYDRMAGDRAAKIAWQIYAKAVIDVLHYGPDRLERLRKESHANYEQLNKWGHEDGLDVAMEKLRRCAADAMQAPDLEVADIDGSKDAVEVDKEFRKQQLNFIKRVRAQTLGRIGATSQPVNVLAEQGVQNKVQLIMQQVSQQPFERRRRR